MIFRRNLFARLACVALATGLAAQGYVEAASAQALSPEETFGASASRPHKARKAKSKKKAKAAAPEAATSQAPAAAAPASALAPAPQTALPAGSAFNRRHAMALDLALAGRSTSSIQALRSLLNEDIVDSDKNPVRLSLGRVLYATGDADAAIETYKQIGRGSDEWFLALEERAWANLRADRPDEALASLKTLLLPIFAEKIGAEPYFLASLTYLRVCDYKSVFKTIALFKERFRPRLKAWEAAGDSDPEAKAKLKEASEIIQKLSLVEAETIQRVYMPDEIKGHTGPENKITKTRDEMRFPEEKSGKEVWLDEVDHIKVSVKGCPRPGTVGSGVAGGSSSGKGGRSL